MINLRLFRCNHKFEIIKKSNVLQVDDMGYPLRLFICKCKKCGTVEHHWLDVPKEELNELDVGKSVLLKWTPYN